MWSDNIQEWFNNPNIAKQYTFKAAINDDLMMICKDFLFKEIANFSPRCSVCVTLVIIPTQAQIFRRAKHANIAFQC